MTRAALALKPLDIRGASVAIAGREGVFGRFEGNHERTGGISGEEVSVENSRLLRNVMAG